MSEVFVQAPARVNIIGEHTDYNDGYVLPTTTALHTRLHARARPDRIVELQSRTLDQSASFGLDDLSPVDEVTWVEYIRGVAAMLAGEGVELKGLSLEIDSTIPLGGGLSSSASLELGVAFAMLGIAGASVDRERLAQLCQRAEHEYAKLQCGIMDQYAVACARKGHAVLLDCRSLAAEQVAVPESVTFVLTDSGVRHQLPDGEYNSRTEECREALRILEPEGIDSLRDLDHEALEANREKLGDRLYRRCRHVISENERVVSAVAAMQDGDIEQLGALISASHASLRDDYEVSCAEVDGLVELADSCSGVLGSRQVGGGFGGCVLSVVEAARATEAAEQIRSGYAGQTGKSPWMHIVEPSEPVQEVEGSWGSATSRMHA